MRRIDIVVTLFLVMARGNTAFAPVQPRQTAAISCTKMSSQNLGDDEDSLFYQRVPLQEHEQRRQDTINSFLRASRDSFKNVEKATDFLLNQQPILAFAIFIGAGLMVAYISGFFILGGYIESINPAENDLVPYWDE